MRDYSKVVPPLIALASTSSPFSCTSKAIQGFQDLKHCFVSAPVLIQLDLSLKFIVEVDASNTDVGVAFSQRFLSNNKLHPSAFLSWWLFPAEGNYDIANCEL